MGLDVVGRSRILSSGLGRRRMARDQGNETMGWLAAAEGSRLEPAFFMGRAGEGGNDAGAKRLGHKSD